MPTSRAFSRFVDVISNETFEYKCFKIQNYTEPQIVKFYWHIISIDVT